MSQLITKFIEDNAVTDAKIRLRNNAPLRAHNALGTADVDLFKLDSSDSFTLMSQPRAATALALPSQAKDYVTVEWAENRIIGKGDPQRRRVGCCYCKRAINWRNTFGNRRYHYRQ